MNFRINIAPSSPERLYVFVKVADVPGADFLHDNDEGTYSLRTRRDASGYNLVLTTKQDKVAEASGSVTITVQLGAGYQVGNPKTASVVVVDDDTPQTLSIEAPADSEENPGGIRNFAVKLPGIVAGDTKYRVCFTGTAQPPGDYTVTGLDATNCLDGVIPSGQAISDIYLNVKGDTDIEPDETVTATLSIREAPANVRLGTSVVTHKILDDDAPLLSISAPADAKEGDNFPTSYIEGAFKVSLAEPATSGFYYQVCFSNSGTATRSNSASWSSDPSLGNFDYVGLFNGSLREHRCHVSPFNAGEKTSDAIGFRVRGDTNIEEDETIIATLSICADSFCGSTPTNVKLGTSTATYKILDDDTPVVTITDSGIPSIREGGQAGFHIYALPKPKNDLTVKLYVEDAPNADFLAQVKRNRRR